MGIELKSPMLFRLSQPNAPFSHVFEGYFRGTFFPPVISNTEDCICVYFCPVRFSNSSAEFFFLITTEMKEKIRQVDTFLSLENTV